MRVLDLLLRFDGEAGVVARRPDAGGEDLRLRGAYEDRAGKEESQAAPAGVHASSNARRASPSNFEADFQVGRRQQVRPPAPAIRRRRRVAGLK